MQQELPAAEAATFTLPADWASAIINGDFSGLCPGDAEDVRLMLTRIQREGFAVVDTIGEPYFHWGTSPNTPGITIGQNVLDYLAIPTGGNWHDAH